MTAQSISSESCVSHSLSSHLDGYGQIDFLSNRFAGIQSRQWATDGGQSFATDNAGLRDTWQISKTASVGEDGLFTGSLVSAPDWRVRNTLSVSAALVASF